jgi:hypothetical protein
VLGETPGTVAEAMGAAIGETRAGAAIGATLVNAVIGETTGTVAEAMGAAGPAAVGPGTGMGIGVVARSRAARWRTPCDGPGSPVPKAAERGTDPAGRDGRKTRFTGPVAGTA